MEADGMRPHGRQTGSATRTTRRGLLAGLTALVLFLGLDLALVSPGPAPSHAVEPPVELKWSQLVPPAPPAPPRSFLDGRPASPANPASPHDGAAPPAGQPDGRWMSGPLKQSEAPAPVVTSLDGKRVRIGGYVVSLDFDATRVKEFLLVPFVGACIHVPPPPANQIVYVKSAEGFEVTGQFEPVWVTGTLKVSTAFTGLAEAGYSLDADKVDHR
jgi:uncharacterized protein